MTLVMRQDAITSGPSLSAFIPEAGPTDPLDGPADLIDRAASAVIASFTQGLSPASLGGAFADWMTHLAVAPGHQLHLAAKLVRKTARFADYLQRTAASSTIDPCIRPLPQDHRFDDPAWENWPFSAIHQAFLLSQQWWDAAATVGGVTPRHQEVVRFVLRQMLDVMAPSNFIATNPVVQRRIVETGGHCLFEGASNLVDDMRRLTARERPAGADRFRVGVDVAATPGKIVYRNRLIELIQYVPMTDSVRPEPVLIVPAWIMKYYILDLSPENSLVRWLAAQGYTVFILSWRNPEERDRDLDLEDYRRLGIMDALDAILAITGAAKVHAAGYCAGGTLLAIAAAAMARDNDPRLATMTLLAAQTEFSEPGELGLFIDEAEVHFLENMMWAQGYLDSRQMSGAFQLLRSNDLIWSRLVHSYLMGEREPLSDLMAWNSDGTRVPYAMHSQYLRALFLGDDLAEGRYRVDGRPIALEDIHHDIFAVATEWDHVAPWRSVHKIHLLTDAQLTFLLATGGHNAGIVSEPGRQGPSYRLLEREEDGRYVDPDNWLTQARNHEGSWWPAWAAWLDSRSGPLQPPPSLGHAGKGYPVLDGAPGSYVRAP